MTNWQHQLIWTPWHCLNVSSHLVRRIQFNQSQAWIWDLISFNFPLIRSWSSTLTLSFSVMSILCAWKVGVGYSWTWDLSLTKMCTLATAAQKKLMGIILTAEIKNFAPGHPRLSEADPGLAEWCRHVICTLYRLTGIRATMFLLVVIFSQDKFPYLCRFPIIKVLPTCRVSQKKLLLLSCSRG